MLRRLASVLVLAASALPIAALAAPPGTGFSYQGILKDGGANANGVYDMRISLRSSPTSTIAATLVGPVNYLDNVPVTNGQFTVQLDYGNQFNNSARYLQIEVRKDAGAAANTGTYDPELLPRPQIVAVPVATNSINLNGQPGSYYQTADNLTGALPAALLSNVPKLDASSNTFAGALRINNSLTGGNVLTVASAPSNPNFGLSTEAGNSILNFDMNLRGTTVPYLKSAGIRLDSRDGFPSIQFLTRPKNGTEIVAMSIDDTSGITIGTKLNGGYPIVATQSAMRTIIGVVKADGTTTGTGFTVVRESRGQYKIDLDGSIDVLNSSVQASSGLYTTVFRQYSNRFYVDISNQPGSSQDADFCFIVTGPRP